MTPFEAGGLACQAAYVLVLALALRRLLNERGDPTMKLSILPTLRRLTGRSYVVHDLSAANAAADAEGLKRLFAERDEARAEAGHRTRLAEGFATELEEARAAIRRLERERDEASFRVDGLDEQLRELASAVNTIGSIADRFRARPTD